MRTGCTKASLLGSDEQLQARSGFRIWTDDFSSMHGILK
jgi:hypothetical protein